MADALDLDAMLQRFRDRAHAVKERPLPPIAGDERTRFIEQAQMDFQDFAIIGDATADPRRRRAHPDRRPAAAGGPWQRRLRSSRPPGPTPTASPGRSPPSTRPTPTIPFTIVVDGVERPEGAGPRRGDGRVGAALRPRRRRGPAARRPGPPPPPLGLPPRRRARGPGRLPALAGRGQAPPRRRGRRDPRRRGLRRRRPSSGCRTSSPRRASAAATVPTSTAGPTPSRSTRTRCASCSSPPSSTTSSTSWATTRRSTCWPAPCRRWATGAGPPRSPST